MQIQIPCGIASIIPKNLESFHLLMRNFTKYVDWRQSRAKCAESWTNWMRVVGCSMYSSSAHFRHVHGLFTSLYINSVFHSLNHSIQKFFCTSRLTGTHFSLIPSSACWNRTCYTWRLSRHVMTYLKTIDVHRLSTTSQQILTRWNIFGSLTSYSRPSLHFGDTRSWTW